MGDAISAGAETFVENVMAGMPQGYYPLLGCIGILVFVIFLILLLMFRHLNKAQEEAIKQIRAAYEESMKLQAKTIDQLLKQYSHNEHRTRGGQHHNRNNR